MGRAENSQPGTLMRAPRLGEILYSHRGSPRTRSLKPTAFKTMPVPFLSSRFIFPAEMLKHWHCISLLLRTPMFAGPEYLGMREKMFAEEELSMPACLYAPLLFISRRFEGC